MMVYSCSDTLLPVRGRKLSILGYTRNSHSLVQIPYSPWGDGNVVFVNIISFCLRCSDTFLPVRGRKPDFGKFQCLLIAVQIPFSPWGDGNRLILSKNSQNVLFRYLSPREGTETLYCMVFIPLSICSDTLLPVRGRKLIILSSVSSAHLVQIPFSPGGDGNITSSVF